MKKSRSVLNKSFIGENLHGFTKSEADKIMAKAMMSSQIVSVKCTIEDTLRIYRELWDERPVYFKSVFGFTPKFAK